MTKTKETYMWVSHHPNDLVIRYKEKYVVSTVKEIKKKSSITLYMTEL